MTTATGVEVDAYFEIHPDDLPELERLAQRADERAGNDDYEYRSPSAVIAAIFNGSTTDEIAEALNVIVKRGGWSFSPPEGW